MTATGLRPEPSPDGAGEARVRAWLDVRTPLERQLQPLGQLAIDRLSPGQGERILDIGCGIGTITAQLAQAVGPAEHVVGMDILAPALDVLRTERQPRANVGVLLGDAQHHAFLPGSFDAAFSRFGTMFFADPVAAFLNIRSALRPGGRIAFVCWRTLVENGLDDFPLRAAAPVLPARAVEAAATAKHLSFADPAFLRRTLAKAGYADIDIVPHDVPVTSGSLAAMVHVCTRFGSLGSNLRDHPDLRPAAASMLADALRVRDGIDGPWLTAAIWTVFARRADG